MKNTGKLFFTISNCNDFHAAKPAQIAKPIKFDDEFKFELNTQELFKFKLVGISTDGNESILANVNYHLQLPQLFDQKERVIELAECGFKL